MITEQDLHEYNNWLMNVWNPNQLIIPFASESPSAFLKWKSEKDNTSELVLFSRFISNNSKLTKYMTSQELIEEFNKQKTTKP